MIETPKITVSTKRSGTIWTIQSVSPASYKAKILMGTSTTAIIQVTTVAAGVAPGPVPSLTASGTTSNSTTLTWAAPTTGTTPFAYQVQQSPAGAPVWTDAGGKVSVLTESITGLSPATTYQFRVVVSNSTGNNTSPTATVTTAAVLPGTPTGLAVVGTPTTTDIQVSWSAPSVGTPPLTYTVQYAPHGGTTFTTFPTTTTALTLDVTGLTAGTAYDFRVFASNTAGSGPNSVLLANVSTASPVVVVPSAPQNLAAGIITNTTIPLSWTAPAQGTPPLQYVIQYRLH